MIGKIDRFQGEYRWLSNFHPVEITYGGIVYPSVENAYQAQKCANESDKQQFSRLGCGRTLRPGSAKRLGKTVEQRKDWDDVRVGIMYELTSLKYKDLVLRDKLKSTMCKILIEGNKHHDAFWGFDIHRNCGENRLGNIIMSVRDDIRKDGITPFMRGTLSFEDIESTFYGAIVNGDVYRHDLVMIELPENNTVFGMTENIENGTVTLTHTEDNCDDGEVYTYKVTATVPNNVFYRKDVLLTYIYADFIQQEKRNG